MLIAHGAMDRAVPQAQSERLAAACDMAGVPNQLIIVPDAGHENLGGMANQATVDFFMTHFGMGCSSDLDRDGEVNFADLNIVLAAWDDNAPQGDVNADGNVDFNDFNQVLSAWEMACGEASK